MIPYIIGFLAIFAACFGLQTLALRASGGKTLKSESNYFSSIARIQTESQSGPKIMLLGSSMTGRLGDRASGFEEFANLGCDGGSAMVTLRAIDQGILPAAPIIVIEANTLAYELQGRGKEIAAAIRTGWFQIGMKTPNLGATARPAAFAYSYLLGRTGDEAGEAVDELLPITSNPAVLSPADSPPLDDKSAALVDEMAAIIGRLRNKGSEVFLVHLPGEPPDQPKKEIAIALACQSATPWWDLTEGLPDGAVGFTDGLHLDASSARKVMLTLQREFHPQ